MIIRTHRILMGILLIVAIVTSSEIPRRSLRLTGQVAGIALDYENNQLQATFEVYVPSADEPIGSKRKIVRGSGKNLEDCILDAKKSNGEELFVDDIAALIIGEGDPYAVGKALEYYQKFKHDHMELKVFCTKGQTAASIFDGDGTVLSTNLSKSAEGLGKVQTVRDLMNGSVLKIQIKGEGSYEIIS